MIAPQSAPCAVCHKKWTMKTNANGAMFYFRSTTEELSKYPKKWDITTLKPPITKVLCSDTKVLCSDTKCSDIKCSDSKCSDSKCSDSNSDNINSDNINSDDILNSFSACNKEETQQCSLVGCSKNCFRIITEKKNNHPSMRCFWCGDHLKDTSSVVMKNLNIPFEYNMYTDFISITVLCSEICKQNLNSRLEQSTIGLFGDEIQLKAKPEKCFCGKDGISKCSKCKGKFYCSKECQRLDWSTHKKICVVSS